jgi:hypothetical protein
MLDYDNVNYGIATVVSIVSQWHLYVGHNVKWCHYLQFITGINKTVLRWADLFCPHVPLTDILVTWLQSSFGTEAPTKLPFQHVQTFIRRTCPSKLRCFCLKKANKLEMRARWRTSVFVTLSRHLILRRRLRHRRWKLLNRFSWLPYAIQDSLPYNKVLSTHAW